MTRFKEFCKDFPTQGGSIVVALTLIFFTGVIVAVRLMLGEVFPDGYEAWLFFLGALAGINTAGMIGKRSTDKGYAAIKAGASPSVNVEGPSQVTVEASITPTPPTPAAPPTPGVASTMRPSDGAVG